MKPSQIAKTTTKAVLDPFEALNREVGKPVFEEALHELFGPLTGIGRNPKSIAQEDLKRARDKQKIEEMEGQDNKDSQETAQRIFVTIQQEYRTAESKTNHQQKELKEEFLELQSEVVKLAKVAGVETKAHIETAPKKIGLLDIKRLTSIVKFLRIKAEESKSAQELVFQRSNAKRTTGMLAWVSGKQMKVHEQGTLQLQG